MNKNSKLKIVLFEKEITQNELSEKTKIPISYISHAINGRFNLSQDQKEKIAEFLNMPVEDLF